MNSGFRFTFGIKLNVKQHVVFRLEKFPHGPAMNSIVLPEEKARASIHAPARKVEPKLQSGVVKVPAGSDTFSLAKIPVAVPPGSEPVMGICRYAPMAIQECALDV